MTDLTAKVLSPMEIAEKVVELEKLQRQLKIKVSDMKAQLLKTTQDLDVLTLKTGSYTISRVKRQNLNVINKKALAEELESMGIDVIYSIDMDYMKPVVKNRVEELNNAEMTDTEYISIRINKE